MTVLKDATEYPRFCPACGERRKLQPAKTSPLPQEPVGVAEISVTEIVFVGSSLLNSTVGSPVTNLVASTVSTEHIELVNSKLSVQGDGTEVGSFSSALNDYVANVVVKWVFVPECLRCGLKWASIPDPGSAVTRKLDKLADSELILILKMMYPLFHNLISFVATETNFSIAYVMRVLNGVRKSADIDAAFVKEFRRRLKESGVESFI